MTEPQNVLVSFTQEECRHLRRALERMQHAQLDDAQLCNGTHTGEEALKQAGLALLLARRIMTTQLEVK